MGSTFVMLLAFLAGGGGSDLADYISPAEYWNHKQVPLSLEAMANEAKAVDPAEMSKLIDDLASADAGTRQQAADRIVAVGSAALGPLRRAGESPIPSVATSAKRIISRIEAGEQAPRLRRLMAIRELGELRKKEGIPALEPLLKSQDPFIADYAAEAIDRIEGKPFHRNHPTDIRSDAYLLPQGCRVVIQLLGPPGGPVDMQAELKRQAPQPGMDVTMPGIALQQMLVAAAEGLGNIRIDAITLGFSGDIGPNSGYVTLIARGTYDSRAIADWFHRHQMPSNHVAGVEIFQPPGGESVVFFPDDHHAAYIASPRGVVLPTEEVVRAIQTGQGRLKEVAEMKRLIDSAPAGQPLWGVAKITGNLAKLPVFAPFDTIDLGSARAGGAINITIAARGSDAQNAPAAAKMVEDHANELTGRMRQMQQAFPNAKPFADAMASIKCDVRGGNATMTARIAGLQSGLFIPPMFRMRPPPGAGPAPAGSRPLQPAQSPVTQP